jgi:hypothetical protein
VSTSPFVSMMRNTAQWARCFVPCALRRLFQQPRLHPEVQRLENEVRLYPNKRHFGQDWEGRKLTLTRTSSFLQLNALSVPKKVGPESHQTRVKDEKIDGMKVGSQHRKVYGIELENPG